LLWLAMEIQSAIAVLRKQLSELEGVDYVR